MPLFSKFNPFTRAARAAPAPSSAAAAAAAYSNPHIATVSARYRRLLRQKPFLSFGLPFVLTVVAGSFFLTPATAIRYERFDRKNHMLDRNEAMEASRRGYGRKGDDSSTSRRLEDGDPAQDPITAREEKRLRRRARFKDRDIREEYWVSQSPWGVGFSNFDNAAKLLLRLTDLVTF